MQPIGKILFISGLVLAAIGLLVWLGGSKLGWFGRLPGDVRIEREGFRMFAPFMTMLLLSLALSAALWLINRFLR